MFDLLSVKNSCFFLSFWWIRWLCSTFNFLHSNLHIYSNKYPQLWG